ncbi:PREDICTED: uncharacterized protein LOC105622642 [Atta cephalotes]|uniref:Uncharacterized protein n=1 Tax=Atta cephalotes TaxID=12957 RepID=A0A158NPI8_ATTCE|nr:PREDICTED: uncharacterized protein LOC105622642 [Atta cephalotes]
MAERPDGGRRRSRRDSADSIRGTQPASKDRRTKRSGKPVKERWLLTRKTWRYMADAGRRLIPDGTHNRPEDIPKIEQYFQEVCQKEPRFLLWRKASYPGSLSFRAQRHRRQIKGGSYRTQASSADEADDARSSPQSFVLSAITSGTFDLAKAKKEWLLTSGGSNGGDGSSDGGGGDGDGGSTPSSPITRRKTFQEDTEAKELADMLQKYLNMHGNTVANPMTIKSQDITEQMAGKEPLDYRSLIDKLQQHLNTIVAQAKREKVFLSQSTSSRKDIVPESMLPYQGDYVHKSLMETLSRYYGKSSSREHVISDILTDRKLLEKLYFDLRCTRGFRGPRATGAYTSPSTRWWTHERSRPAKESNQSPRRDPISLPPLIAVQGPSTDRSFLDNGVQTDPISQSVLDMYLLEKEKEESSQKEYMSHRSGRRCSSVDNDDVSPSVSDTIKRYLRMARKKSMDTDKIDRFKRVNYDRNLRNIKAKGEITKPGDDDGNNKGCQTEDNWMVHYREMSFFSPGEIPSENLSDADTTTSPPVSRNASSRSSIDAGLGSEETSTPVKHPHHHQSFLSHLLHGSNMHKPHSAPGSPALTSSSANSADGTAMQKSKSSSNVVHHGSRLVAKKIWRSRSKSTSRVSHQPSVWTPQGKCTWAGTGSRRVTLQDTSLRTLSDIERKVLCKVAVAKLQALNLGVHIRPPCESLGTGSVTTNKPKRRAYLLKRKALTTGFFDNKGKDEKEKDIAGGLVFGIPLSQCIENDRITRIAAGEIIDVGCLSRSSRHGSRTSFSSFIETPPTVAAKTEEVINSVTSSVQCMLSTGNACYLRRSYLPLVLNPHPVPKPLSSLNNWQGGDEIDPCSEAETFSVEETLTMSTTRKMWTREQCLHQTAGVGGDIGPKHRRPKKSGSRRKEEGRSNSLDSGSSEDPSDPRRKSSPIIITASLTIPMSDAFTLNLDDPDIPYIEETPKQPSAPPRRQRQRSISGCSEGGRHGSDSAVGSSATLSGDQTLSSPPSWASSPPASPDSAVTAVSYIPDQQAVLQRVSFTTSSEVRQVNRSTGQQETSRSTAVPYTPSITSIGGAVLRSKTADIERMLQISRSDFEPTSLQTSKNSTVTSNESKKYTKRRYTDSRHQTRHIPDADTLAGKTPLSMKSTSISPSSSTSVSTQKQRVPTQPVWKRRELISSAPKDREGYF